MSARKNSIRMLGAVLAAMAAMLLAGCASGGHPLAQGDPAVVAPA
ncbi:hypothetical protein [Mycobacterium riyadhense]|nr:hypothetical protein [Mycobacterium riyadhense]